MASIGLTTDGAGRLSETLGAAGDALVDLAQVNRSEGEETIRAAEIPVDTGRLERSAYVDAGPAGFELLADAPYAGYVHEYDPFFTRALEQRAEAILDRLAQHTDTVLSTVQGA